MRFRGYYSIATSPFTIGYYIVTWNISFVISETFATMFIQFSCLLHTNGRNYSNYWNFNQGFLRVMKGFPKEMIYCIVNMHRD